MKKTSLLTLALLAYSYLGYGQDTLRVAKKDLLEKVGSVNLQIQQAQKTYEGARADYRQTNALFLPNIMASHTAISTTNPLMAFGSKLNQEILTASDFNPALLNDPAKTQNFATVISVQQPLLNADGLYQRKAAYATMQAYALQVARTKEYMQLEVSKAYMQLQLAYQAVTVLTKANTTAQANLKLIEQYFKQGLVQKTDVLNVEIRVTEVANQLQYAKSGIQNASDYLGFILNEDTKNKIYQPTDTLERSINVTAVVNEVPENRKDLQAMHLSTSAYEKIYRASRMNFLPRLNAFGSYELYDQSLFGTKAQGYVVGAQLSWNVFDGSKSLGKMARAKADFQKASIADEQYKKQSQMEVSKTNRQLLDAEQKVRLSQLALVQAQEAYRIRQNRFAQGLEKTTDLLQSETQMQQKELESLQAVFEYGYTKAYLAFLTE
jgi:outer membrane protein TolC